MNIHEYQAKSLFRKYGIPVSEGKIAHTADEAEAIAKELGGQVVVKAQIHAGGRGKGGGVKLADNPQDAKEKAEKIIGMNLVTPQTGAEGKKVNLVLIEHASDIEKELYLSAVVDRAANRVVIMASTEGGMDIEEVAEKTPEKIFREYVDPAIGLGDFQARRLAFGYGLEGDLFKQGVTFFKKFYKCFVECDCSLAEINPLIITTDGKLRALDAKLTFDETALYRHPDIAEFRDLSEEEELEIKASDAGLNYVRLTGNVGCMVNGAGLAMATMDAIKYAGSFPANFLDIGGKAKQEQVETAFQILTSDPNVKAILINMFGGIVRTDMVAEGIIAAAKNIGVKIPMVVRLKGTNSEQAAEILKNSGLTFEVADDIATAAEKVVAAAGAS